jgi:large subunit ribosomal protein L10
MAKTRQSKEETLTTLVDKLKRMKSLVFTHYQGLTVKDVTELRSLLRKEQVDLLVAKKTLLRKALKEVNADTSIVDQLDGDLALAFGFGDEVTPAKLLQAFAKTHPTVKLSGGLVEGQFLNAEQAVALAKLPSRPELLAKTVYVLNSPISGFVQVLGGTMRGLINVLQALQESKPAAA